MYVTELLPPHNDLIIFQGAWHLDKGCLAPSVWGCAVRFIRLFGCPDPCRRYAVFGRGRNPASQSVVGFAVMFLLFSLSGAASSLFEERDKHIFQRLLSGGVTRSDVLILSMSALGGAMFPLFMMPAFMQDFVAPLTLVYWAVDGMLGVLWRDEGIIDLRKHIAIFTPEFAGLILSVAWRGFHRGKLFS
ncbi:MAG: hypothetical protein LR015_06270 [Verrucomicrobia bacterium]|nr:hypothetical protein [Verrucomicrobiota bacterium]